MNAPEPVLPPAPARRIWEIKERLNGEQLRFELECWLQSERLVVARWLAPPGNPYGIPAGTFSWGCWWRDRSYGAYRIHRPDGSLRAYRLDAVERVRIGPQAVHYRDLLLDAWLTPDGALRLEDVEEVEEEIAAGRLSAHERRRIDCTRLIFERRGAQIVARIDAAIAAAVARVAAAAEV